MQRSGTGRQPPRTERADPGGESSRGSTSTRRIAVALLAAGLLWRAIAAFAIVPFWESSSGHAPFPDSYQLLGRSLVEEGAFGYGEAGASPTTLRAPAFPLWLAAGILIGGERSAWLGFWSGVPGVIAGVLLFGWATRRAGLAAGLCGFAIAVCHPLPSLMSARTMSDEFAGALAFIAIGCWAFLAETDSGARRLGLPATTALATAACLLTNSSAVLVAAAVGLIVLARHRARWRFFAALLALSLVPALAWSLRSSVLEGRPVYLHSMMAYNFWLGEGIDRAITASHPPRLFPDAVGLALSEAGWDYVDPGRFEYIELAPQDVARLDRELGAAARRRIVGDPFGYLARVVRGVPLFWVQAESKRRTLQYAALVAPVVLLAVAGGVAHLRNERPRDALGSILLAWLLLGWMARAAVLPMARHSVQYYPALAWLAGLAVATLVGRHAMRRGATSSAVRAGLG